MAVQPVSDGDLDSILAGLDEAFDLAKSQPVSEGRRVEFYPGKRKMKDGKYKRTGHYYWQWVYKDPDTGKRKRPYGGPIETVPAAYQYRYWQYQARINSRGAESLADALLRPALNGLRISDTGKE